MSSRCLCNAYSRLNVVPPLEDKLLHTSNKFAHCTPVGAIFLKVFVTEQVADFLKTIYFIPDYKFSTSGREDIDVKCLGNGEHVYSVISLRII